MPRGRAAQAHLSNGRSIGRHERCEVANHISKQRSARPIRPVAALPSVDSDRLGLSSSAIRLSIDSSFTWSTLSAVIKVRISGSDNAPLSVNSWLAVFMKYPLVVSGIYMRPKPDSGTATLSVGPSAHHLPLVQGPPPAGGGEAAQEPRAGKRQAAKERDAQGLSRRLTGRSIWPTPAPWTEARR
jgi:hypothetical protein